MPDVKYPKNPNSDTAFVEEDGKRTRAIKVAVVDGTIDYPKNANSDSCYVTIDGKKQRALMVADVSGEGTVEYPNNPNSTKGYIEIDGKKQRVVLTASLAGGGSAPVIDELNVTPSTSAQVITAPEGTDGYSPVNVSAVTSSIDANITAGNIKDGVEILGVTGTYTGGGSSTKLGLSIDNLIGDVDGNGVLQPVSQKISSIDLSGVVEISTSACQGMFSNRGMNPSGIFDSNGCAISAPDLETVGQLGCSKMFYLNYYISSASFPKLKTIGASACSGMFALETESSVGLLTSIDLSSVETIGSYGCESMFYGRRTLTSVNLSGVKTIGDWGLSKAFQYTGLTSISFNALTSVGSNAFGGATTTNTFRSCSSLTAIHFPAAMQSAIESQAGYANKWGATNATIYFDL